MKRNIPLMLLLFLALVFTQCTQPETFEFVFMTDIHLQPERRGTEGFATAIETVNELNPDFVLTGGDLIMDALGVSYARADSLFEMYLNLSQNFQMPVYNTIGNHEVFGLYEKSGISPQHEQYGKVMYLDRMDYEMPYYSFDHQGWHFMVLDGIGFTPERRYYGHIDSLQMQWIQNDLATVDPRIPIVVSTHIPLVSVYGQMVKGANYGMSQGEVVTNAKDVLQLFENHNLKLVLQGHLHEVEEIIYKGTHFITAGAVSGEWWKGPRDGFPEGFALIKTQGDEFTWSYETFGWDAENSEKRE